MAFFDYREPIEYVVDRYFERKRFHAANTAAENGMGLERGEYPDGSLPEIPCLIIRDEEDRAYKFIYGELSMLENDEEGDPVIWQEVLMRNTGGLVVNIITTYPDGETVETSLFRDTDGKVAEYKYS